MKKKMMILLAFVFIIPSFLAGCDKKEPVSDTIKWINTTYAILTEANNGDINDIGGFRKTDSSKKLVIGLLEDWWDVTDRTTADETLDYLLAEGHRASFVQEMGILKAQGVLDMSTKELQDIIVANKIEDGPYLVAMIEAHQKYGDEAITAWDYCRALQLLGYYYVADYYTEQETLDKSLEIAKELQAQFGSWEEVAESYLYGYQYWQEDDATDPDSDSAKRRSVYDALKTSDDNPYTLDWNTPLTKTW